MTTGRRGIAAVLAVAAVIGLPALQPGAAGAEVPFQFHGVTLQGVPDDGDIARLDGANVGVVRFFTSWQATEPAPDIYDWRSMDDYLREIGRSGAKPLPFFGAFPGWLDTDLSGDPMSTASARDAWRDFVEALLARYGPGGEFTTAEPDAARIHTWQIWNEPNLDGPWGGTADPTSYARMVEIASEVIRDRDPDAEIMLAGLAPAVHSIRPWDFTAGLLEVLDPETFDTAAIHTYAPDQAGVNSQIFRVREAMLEGGAGDKQLAITEFGWSSSRHAIKSVAGTPKSQARHVRKAYRLFARNKGWNLSEALWYSLRDTKAVIPGCGFCSTSGLLRANGDPKPAWGALKRLIRRQEAESAPDDYAAR